MTSDLPIRDVRTLLGELARGGRLIRREAWELNEANQWRQYELVRADGTRLHVFPRCAIAADRRGLVRPQKEGGACS